MRILLYGFVEEGGVSYKIRVLFKENVGRRMLYIELILLVIKEVFVKDKEDIVCKVFYIVFGIFEVFKWKFLIFIIKFFGKFCRIYII